MKFDELVQIISADTEIDAGSVKKVLRVGLITIKQEIGKEDRSRIPGLGIFVRGKDKKNAGIWTVNRPWEKDKSKFGAVHADENALASAREPSTKKIAFMHIPKTGGISVENSLKKAFAQDDIAPLYYPDEYDTATEAGEFGDYKLWIGHFDYDVLMRLGEGYVKAIVFRDPLSLVVSYYNYAAYRPMNEFYERIHAGELPFARFCEEWNGTKNLLTKYVLGRTAYKKLLRYPKPDKQIEVCVSQVREHLKTFDCIGVTEDLPAFKTRMEAIIGTRLAAFPHLNASKTKVIDKMSLTEEDVAVFRKANWLDIPVYEELEARYAELY
jgi:hypothetical protein